MLFGSHGAVYTASICSTFTLMATIIILPIVHNRAQQKLSLILSHVDLCKQEGRDIWKQMTFGPKREKRAAGSAYESGSNPYGASSYSGSGACCACSQGAPGPR